MAVLLGISCSLRNARFGSSGKGIEGELAKLDTEEALQEYLEVQNQLHVENFIRAGRGRGEDFGTIYRNLTRNRAKQGLSNSEVTLAAGLWGGMREGATIRHLGVSEFFPASGEWRNLDRLRDAICAADALLISGPVYFGDRGSPAQDLVQFIQNDPACRAHVKGKVYGGISVGAKRNGGQETLLIFQMIDMANLDMLVVGNDAATTGQYGGTALAGDVGTAAKDSYGIRTSIGTGRRLAAVAAQLAAGDVAIRAKPLKIAIWILQDTVDGRGGKVVARFCAEVESRVAGVKFEVRTFVNEVVHRCIACDICPVKEGPIEDYRCIIGADDDAFKKYHASFVDADAVIPMAYSPEDLTQVKSVYQRFIERTRYLRRDDYALGNCLTAPFVISEINANQNLHIRMLTSMIRHMTILHHPLIGRVYKDELLNFDQLVESGVSFAHALLRFRAKGDRSRRGSYNPIGYVISAESKGISRPTGG
ncbi:MAG: NAD(P)H-dependent oxidoreductase [Magnetospirillum sp.]|nr:NAD(P)H-dependent oxidoreductase [Magnetospirillum sp.]